MCFDEANWKFKQYLKHHTPPAYRDRPLAEIDAMTRNSDSRYYPQCQQRDIEESVLREGTYVRSPKPNTVYKVNEFPSDIGASNGQPSRWVKVESTSGEFHGRPIAESEYRKFMNHTIACCN